MTHTAIIFLAVQFRHHVGVRLPHSRKSLASFMRCLLCRRLFSFASTDKPSFSTHAKMHTHQQCCRELGAGAGECDEMTKSIWNFNEIFPHHSSYARPNRFEIIVKIQFKREKFFQIITRSWVYWEWNSLTLRLSGRVAHHTHTQLAFNPIFPRLKIFFSSVAAEMWVIAVFSHSCIH